MESTQMIEAFSQWAREKEIAVIRLQSDDEIFGGTCRRNFKIVLSIRRRDLNFCSIEVMFLKIDNISAQMGQFIAKRNHDFSLPFRIAFDDTNNHLSLLWTDLLENVTKESFKSYLRYIHDMADLMHRELTKNPTALNAH